MSRRVERICELGLQQETIRMVEGTAEIGTEIAMERVLQNHRWGGPQHDDSHTPANWADYIHHQLSKMFQEEGSERDRFLKVAALAQAAVEAFDRKNAQVCECPACAMERKLSNMFGSDVKVQVVRVDEGVDMGDLLRTLLSGGKVPPGAARG